MQLSVWSEEVYKKKLHRTTCTDSDFWRAAFIDIFCSDFVHRPLKKKYLAFNLVKRITPIIQYWGLGRFIIGFDLSLHHEMYKRYLEAMSPYRIEILIASEISAVIGHEKFLSKKKLNKLQARGRRSRQNGQGGSSGRGFNLLDPTSSSTTKTHYSKKKERIPLPHKLLEKNKRHTILIFLVTYPSNFAKKKIK